MIRRPPRSTRPDPPFPYTPLFLSSISGRTSSKRFSAYDRNTSPRTAARNCPTDNDEFARRLSAAVHNVERTVARSVAFTDADYLREPTRSEEHTSELQSLMRISDAVFCLKKKRHETSNTKTN